MSTERWEHIKRVFNAAMERHAAERTAFVEEFCGNDAELKREVLSLIQAARPTLEGGPVRTAGAVNAFANASPSAFTAVQLTERAGSVVGHYKLLQSIGEGGFGTVFLADQTAPVRRRVALKIIKHGMDTRSVVARFEAERQALALMDHPNIARVFDAGSTDSGRPYFVMEYVKGDPITLFADAHTLTLRERLELLTQVCHAVQHAHQKGVIHRDIKPSNVLVSMVDGKPLAKVIDFGIAKATGAAGGTLTDKTLFTEHRALIGTPEYMSPEQAEGSPDIDTRTDVYGLGVLMYELLTGTTPFEPSRLRSAAYAEMQRIIKEEEPPSPSLRISRDLQRDLKQLASTAAHRKVEPQRLNTLMRGELDWIVMKALDKDRARRFATPQDLAADIDRHLRGEAVVAAPASAAYRVRKFVRRNKGAVGAVSAVVLALSAGLSVAGWQTQRAERIAASLRQEQADVRAAVLASITKIYESKYFKGGMTPEPGQYLEVKSKEWGWRINRSSNGNSLDIVGLRDNGTTVVPATTFDILTASQHYNWQTLMGLENSVEQLRMQTDAAEWSAYTANLALAQAAMDAGNYPEARKRLADAPVSKRGWEWKFAQHDAESVIWTTNEPSLSATAIRHDGQEIAISNRDRIDIRLAADGTLLRVLHADLRDSMSVADLSYSVDGTLLAAAGTTGGSAYLLNADNGEIIRRISDLPAACWSATISPDGLRLATSAGRQIDVWDVRTGKNLSRCTLKDTYAQLLRFSADGTHLLFVDFQHERVNALVTGSCEQIPASSSEVLAMKELLRDRPWGIATNEAGLVTDMKNGRMSGSDSMSFERFLRVSSQSAAGGPTREFVAYNDADDQLLSLRVAAILASSPNGPSGLTITTPDGARRIVGGSDKTVRFYEAKPAQIPAASTASPDAPAAAPASEVPPRELAVFRMPAAVTNLQMTADGTRLIISLEDGSARVWDIREPEERCKDMQAKWAERVPAGQYLDSQWSTQVPTPKLRDTIIADATLTPLRRLVAVEMLEERINETNRAAEEARNTLTKDATPTTDPATIQAAAAATDLPPRVKERLITLVADWKPPAALSADEQRLATETMSRRLAEATLTIRDYDMTYASAARDDALQAAYGTFSEVRGTEHIDSFGALTKIAEGSLSQTYRKDAVKKLDERFARIIQPIGLKSPQAFAEAQSLAELLVECDMLERATAIYHLMGRDLSELIKNHGTASLRYTFRYVSNIEGNTPADFEKFATYLGSLTPETLRENWMKYWLRSLMTYSRQPLPLNDSEWRRANVLIGINMLEDAAQTDADAATILALGQLRIGSLAAAHSSSTITRRIRGENALPLDLIVLSLTHIHLATKDEANTVPTSESKSGTDVATKPALSATDHRLAAREALTKAQNLMSDPAHAETWAKDPDAKALLAEAEALINPK